MKIHFEIEHSDLVNADARALADVIGSFQGLARQVSEAETTEKPIVKTKKVKRIKKKPADRSELMAMCKKMGTQGRLDELQEILARHGVASMADVNDSILQVVFDDVLDALDD